MIKTQRALVLAGITTLSVVMTALSTFTLTGCRTSEQSRRGLAASRASQGSPLAQQLDSMRMIQQKLVEVIDSMASLAETDQDRIRALEADVAMLRSRIEGTSLPQPPPDARRDEIQERGLTGPPPVQPRLAQPSVVTPSAGDATDRYNAALRLFQDNNFAAALDAFQKLEQDDPRGTFAGNYKYWEGESYYALKQYSAALKQFRSVLSDYSRSPKAAASEFKIGECYERLDRPTAARAAYERLLADYPNTEYNARARARIRALPSEQ